MKKAFFEELNKMSRNDEFREVLLMNGVKRILSEKKDRNLLQRFFSNQGKLLEALKYK